MPFSTTSRRRLAMFAAACLLSVALPAGSAVAQKTKSKGTPAVEATTPAPAPVFTVEIPDIDTVGSNVDEDTLRAIFSGDIAGNAEELAGLSATSITIPEITLSVSTTVAGEGKEATMTFSDLVLSDVTDGVAASVTLAGADFLAGEEGSGQFGSLTASSLDIGSALRIYGLADADGRTDFATLYTDFSFEGGTFVSPEVSCTIGTATAGEFKARPLAYSLTDMVALLETIEEDDEPSPEVLGKLLHMYADIFTAIESDPTHFDGFDCSGVDDDGRPLSFTIAGMSMGGMSPGFYPSFSMDGFEVEVEGDGTVKLGNFTFKAIDMTGPLAVMQTAPEVIDEAWLLANMRGLIPSFEGFSFSDMAVDVPDPDSDGERIQASIGAFDLSLGNYVNGIPTDLLTSVSNIFVQLPEDSDDEQLQQLLALGVTSIDAGFIVDAAWNEADDTIAVDEISITGANLATVKLAGTIANATEALFGLDENQALMAAMGVAISQLKLDVTDLGLSDIILATVAAEQGSNPQTMRPVFAGLAQGTIVGMLAGAAEAQKVGHAVNDFVSGKAKYLSIELTAKQAPGLGLMDFMAAESDPTALIGKVNINATAK